MAPVTSVFLGTDTVLAQMLSQLQSSGSTITDFSTGSGIRTLYEGVSIVISGNTATADQLQLDSYLDTATGAALDALGANNWFVPRVAAVQATGEITITRQSTSGALLIPAGWGQLTSAPAVAGDTGVAVLTTEDASFANGSASVTVTAQAVLGGSAGNLSAGVYLTPVSAISTVSSQNGYEITTAFTNGVDAESDSAYRARIPLTVQGRVGGKVSSFLAAALSVPGVTAASVLTPGMLRGNGTTVPVATAEVYFEGSAGLLSQVQSAVLAAATSTQDVTAYAAIGLSAPRGPQRVVANLTVYVPAGTDTTTTRAAVVSALQAYVDSVTLGGTVYLSQAILAVLAVTGVETVALPFSQFSLYGETGAADIAMTAGDCYPNLASADVTVTVDTIAS